LSIPDILEVPRVINGYPTEKPVPLCEVLIAQSSNEGDIVVDPFLGSGAVGVAATNLKRDFAGSDTNKEAVNLAIARINMT
jgi:site-specific DNA-methyltransferase (adenine-specific)